MKINIIDLFCGAGGFSLGFELEGFDSVLAIDKWSDAVETYNYNRENKVAQNIDIHDYTNEKIVKLMNDYKAGKHLEWDRTVYRRGKKMTVRSKKFSAVNVDGECEFVKERTFEVVPQAINFMLPSTVDFDAIHGAWDEENKVYEKLFTFAV